MIIIGVFLCFQAAAAPDSDAPSVQDVHQLNQRVQQIKLHALEMMADLDRLKAQVMYPPDTHTVIYVSMDKLSAYTLQSLSVEIDNEIAVSHVYRKEELEAIINGGIQRLYEGNLGAGKHEMMVHMKAAGMDGKQISRNTSLQFDKGAKKKIIKLNLNQISQDNSIISIEEM